MSASVSALVGAIVGEFLGAREGMGLLIATAQVRRFQRRLRGVIVIAVVALIANGLLTDDRGTAVDLASRDPVNE